MNFANFCKEFYKKIIGTVQYYYLRYFSKKAGTTVERIAVGTPVQGSRGTMLYNDFHAQQTRSYCVQNLCEIRKINSQNELTHYQKYLTPTAQNLSLKTASLVTIPQTVCKPIKESEDFAGSQVDEILPSGYTAEQEEQMLWAHHLYELQMQQEYGRN